MFKQIANEIFNGNNHGKEERAHRHAHLEHKHTKFHMARHGAGGHLNRSASHAPILEKYITTVNSNGSEKHRIAQEIKKSLQIARRFKEERRSYCIL